MKQVVAKPLSVRIVLIAALALIVSAGVVDGTRKFNLAKHATQAKVTVRPNLEASTVTSTRSL